MESNISQQNHQYVLSNWLREADDLHHNLARFLYESANLSYDKGSRRGDYTLRDRVNDLNEMMMKFYDTVKLFANARHGDVRAFGDILVFFENSFFEFNIIEYKISVLKEEIQHQLEEDKNYNLNIREAGLMRKVNLFIEELTADLGRAANVLSVKIYPLMIRFITLINNILLIRNITELIEQPQQKGIIINHAGNLEKTKQHIGTFLWYFNRTNPTPMDVYELAVLIESLITNMDLIKGLVSKCASTPQNMKQIILDSVMNFENIIAGRNLEIAADKIINESIEKNRTEKTKIVFDLPKMNDFLTELCSVNLETASPIAGFNPWAVPVKDRVVFNRKNGHSYDLKIISGYLIDSLIFIAEWIMREIKKPYNSIDYLKPIYDAVTTGDKFVTLHIKAMLLSELKDNQTKSGISAEIICYINHELAENLIKMSEKICMGLHNAFIESFLSAAEMHNGKSENVVKKIVIIQESFNATRLRINETIRLAGLKNFL
jgi:hypothetical protein